MDSAGGKQSGTSHHLPNRQSPVATSTVWQPLVDEFSVPSGKLIEGNRTIMVCAANGEATRAKARATEAMVFILIS